MRQWERTAASLLTHYLGAVRVARRATRLAYAEGRLARGKVLKAWFCQQVFAAWDARRGTWAQSVGRGVWVGVGSRPARVRTMTTIHTHT